MEESIQLSKRKGDYRKIIRSDQRILQKAVREGPVSFGSEYGINMR